MAKYHRKFGFPTVVGIERGRPDQQHERQQLANYENRVYFVDNQHFTTKV
jgi:hypothetical protein